MKIALVSGAGQGLGQGFCEYLSQIGYFVYAGVRKLTEVNNNSDPNIKELILDVQDDSSIKRAIDVIRLEKGSIDLLINNAGLNKDTATSGNKALVSQLNSLDRSILLKMFDVNAISPLMVTKYALGLMTNSPAYIINISSNRASFKNAMDDTSANYGYKASKAALNMFSKVLVFDLPKNVQIVAVHPGSVLTKMNPAGSLKPTEAAQKICQIIENWQPNLNGQFVDNDGTIRDR